jgi:hypothetical protein
MISAIATDQPVAASSAIEYRHRVLPGERSVLPDSTPPAPANSQARNNSSFDRDERRTPAQPEAPAQESASMFAAAVISGALPPVPQTMEQLIQRIGLSPIPEESQARLKDLLA